ncbi:fungal-specific transcription factor domain-containing protein [Tricladium varicosporioides]|nr:fungal-specific transcription factor domain-containing protein [Hymenoscyphus varicosporioides]
MNSNRPLVPARQRNRASVACISCRASRTKVKVVVVNASEMESNACFVTTMVVGGRKRNKTYTTALLKRIELLEDLVKQNGGQLAPPPPPPLATVQEQGQSQQDSNAETINAPLDMASPPTSVQKEPSNILPSIVSSEAPSPDINQQNLRAVATGAAAVTPNVLTIPHLQVTGLHPERTPYFGRTANMHVQAKSETRRSKHPSDPQWRIEMLLPNLSTRTLEYLMSLYWNFHNSHIHLVHKVAFQEDRLRGRAEFYSIFLHLCMLSIGFRYADRVRPDIKSLLFPNHESLIHVKALKMAESELKRPGGIPSVQAFFLLADLECSRGRDDTGWMYSGMSFRLALDLGLHLEPRDSKISERDLGIQRMVMYWSLYLGRPTSMRSNGICTKQKKEFDRLIASRSATIPKMLETKAYEALITLMDIAGNIVDLYEDEASNEDTYLQVACLDRQLRSWYNTLPVELAWSPENMVKAPFSLYLLHQQYHTVFILLHRSSANLDLQIMGHRSPDYLSSSSQLSRDICLHHSIQIAEIFREHRKRFDTKRIFVTAIQHAGSAVITLMSEITHAQKFETQRELLDHVKSLHQALIDMAETYEPTSRMAAITKTFLKDFGIGLGESGESLNHLRHNPIVSNTTATNIITNSSSTTLGPSGVIDWSRVAPSPVTNTHSMQPEQQYSPQSVHEAFWGGWNPDLLTYIDDEELGSILNAGASFGMPN